LADRYPLYGTGRTDAILLRHAHRAAGDPKALEETADLACATTASRERHSEACDQGRAFMLAAAAWGIPEAPERIPYAVAIGAVAGAHRIPKVPPPPHISKPSQLT
jgi:urease accessory protein